MLQTEEMGMPGVVRSIYDAALDAARWPEFLARFAVDFSSESALIFGQDYSHRSVDIGEHPASFALHYCRSNIWTENEHLHHEGQVVNASRLYPERYLPKTEWYGNWLRPLDLFHSFATIVEKRAHRSLNVAAVRSKRGGSYTVEDETRLRALMPHLQTAFALYRRLHRTDILVHASLAVPNGIPVGAILLDSMGSVLHANAKAHAFVRSPRLLSLGTGDTLHRVLAGDDLWLQRPIREAGTTGSGVPLHLGSALRTHGLEGAILHILVEPLPSWLSPSGKHTAAAAFISDPAAAQTLEDALRNFYHLPDSRRRAACQRAAPRPAPSGICPAPRSLHPHGPRSVQICSRQGGRRPPCRYRAAPLDGARHAAL